MRYSFLKRCMSTIMAAALAVVISIPAYASSSVKNASWGLKNLTASEQTMYDHLISELERIISEGGSTKITFDDVQFDSHDVATAEASDLWDKLYTYVSNNHPELLFFEEVNRDDPDSENMEVGESSFSVEIGVDKKYRGADEYSLNTNAAYAAASAKSVADSVISQNSNKGTYDTIKAYADWIADHVSYDHAAASLSTSDIKDSSPWSLISVFDQDSSTNVVCEGYAKAFQYLMDNTARFVSAGVKSKIVTSTVKVSSGSGSAVSGSAIGIDDSDDDTGHMWNVVTISGKNYLVDVTWYDTDSSTPYRTDYLLGGSDSLKSDTTGLHGYDSDTYNFYSDDELKLSEKAYDKLSADPVTTGTKGSSEGDSENTGSTKADTGSSTGSTGSASSDTGSIVNTGNSTSVTGNTSQNTSSTVSGSTAADSSTTGTGSPASTTGNTSQVTGNEASTTGNTVSDTGSNTSTTGSNNSNTGSTVSNTGSTVQTTGNTASVTGNSTSTTGGTSSTSVNGSSASGTGSDSTNADISSSLPVQYSTSGAQTGGDQVISATIDYNTLQTGDTSYPWTETETETEEEEKQAAQIAAVEKKKGSVTSLSAGSRKLTMKFKKISVSGKTVRYQVAIKQSSAKSWKKSFVSTTKKTFTGLKKGGKYWVSVRPYITIDGVRYFGKWSKTLTKKVK